MSAGKQAPGPDSMRTLVDALRWALGRIVTAKLGQGDYFERADALLAAAERSAVPARAVDADDESGFPCPRCEGSGTITVMSDNGPDAHEVDECCPHCEGAGSLDAAYRGVLKLYEIQRAETIKNSGKLWGLKHSREAREAFLLEVGEDLARWHDPIGYWKDYQARAAIAKAEGSKA